MPFKICMSDFRVEQLDSKSLTCILKFAHALKKHNGTVLQVKDEKVIKQVIDQVRHTDCDELKELYQELKHSLRAQVSREPMLFMAGNNHITVEPEAVSQNIM